MSYGGTAYIRHPKSGTEDEYFSYTCGHCGTKVAGIVLAVYTAPRLPVLWLLCTSCGDGSVRSSTGAILPGTAYGPIIEGVPELVSNAYEEARACISVDAFTSCELICRKILMHIAVEKGAEEGREFAHYLSFLSKQGYITPPMTKWVELIRKHGNKATHLIEEADRKRTESTLMFTAELLRLIYEMEHIAKEYTSEPKTGKES